MKATIKINKENIISKIDDRLFSSFIEHMGRGVYTGIYEPGHSTADEQGFRGDVMDMVRELSPTYIRYPGGNFVSGYRWEDGVGPKEKRPVRRELAWMALEPNEVGTNEFVDFCKKTGTSPMLAVNLGTRGPQEATDLLEYCNIEGGTYYSDLRKSHGYEQPHNIKLWCLGNEMDGPWQICAKTAEEYGRVATETAKMMKWMDPSIELVACGSSNKEMPTFGAWERTVLGHCYDYVDYLSLHQYYGNDAADHASFLAKNLEMNEFINEVFDIVNDVKKQKNSDKQVYLSFDEYNVWFHYAKSLREGAKECPEWTVGRARDEEAYEYVDALCVAALLNTLINNSDKVKIACLAQLINVIAPIITTPGGKAYATAIYHPFHYASKYGRGTALKLDITSDTYDCNIRKAVPYIDSACVLSDDEKFLTLFLVNKNLDSDMPISIDLGQFSSGNVVETVTMSDLDLTTVNTVDEDLVAPVIATEGLPQPAAGVLTLDLAKASYTVIRIRL